MRVSYLLLAATTLSIAGCAATSKSTNQVTYTAPSFNASAIEASKIAILPVVAGAGVEGYRRPFGDAVNETAAELLPSGSYLPWNQTMDRLNEANLVEAYQTAIAAYASTSIVPRQLLQQMSRATGTKYFMYVSLGVPQNETRTRASFISRGGAVDRHVGVSAYGQVWDSNGDVVWEGVGKSEVNSSSDAMQFIREADSDITVHSQRAAVALMRGVMGLSASSR